MVSAGSGPRASMPSRRSRSTAGATTRASSCAERAVFAGVRIEARDREARLRDAEARAQVARDDPAGLDDEFGREALRHVAHRHVDGHRHHGELGRPQHHHRMRGAAGALLRKPGEEFGVAGLGEAVR